jgi:hypothetical protein
MKQAVKKHKRVKGKTLAYHFPWMPPRTVPKVGRRGKGSGKRHEGS